MTNTRPEVDEFTRRFEEAMRPAVRQATTIIAKPYRRTRFWLLLIIALLMAINIAQFIIATWYM